MKNFIKIIMVVLLAASSHFTYAQCDKTVVLTSSKTSFLDDKGDVTRTLEQNATITISKKIIRIDPKNDDHEMIGTITSYACDWKTPFKDGKSIIKATIEDINGEQQHATIIVFGTEGKITLTYEAAERPGVKIQVSADKFEEKKEDKKN